MRRHVVHTGFGCSPQRSRSTVTGWELRKPIPAENLQRGLGLAWIGIGSCWMISRSTRLLLALFLAMYPSSFVHAQTTISGALAGVVTDRTQAVVPGAEVEIK